MVGMVPPLYRNRAKVCTDIWSIILSKKIFSRKIVISLLRKYYKENNIEPIRGRTKIHIFDKEMATLYLIGKHGLGLTVDEYRKYYEAIFYKELIYEKIYKKILEEDGENIRELIKRYYDGKIDENFIFRVIRIAFTATLLGFETDENMTRLLNILHKSFKEISKRIMTFIKLYITYRIAEKIVMGEISSRIEKEAYKHSLCVKFNILKSAPSDKLIKMIAIDVLKGEEYMVNRAFKTKIDYQED